jgi:hypothetical protein
MPYIIERPLTLDGAQSVISYLVDSETISYMSQGPLRMNVMRVSMQGLKMIPGRISPLKSLNKMTVEEVKQRLAEKVCNGTTTLLATAKVNGLQELERELNLTRHLLISSPIDYCIGLSLSPKKLTPEVIRYCMRKKIPFIELECKDYEELEAIVWERIREANFPYQTVIYPSFSLQDDEKKKKNWFGKWMELASRLQISTLGSELEENNPVPLPFLKWLGIYPRKGGLFAGSDVDYCLMNNADSADHPCAVAVRGTIIYSKGVPDGSQGFGKEITVLQPRRFGESPLCRV